ncbi:MAG TPA: DegT/DnrJ/EryC1/StrS family aminotransferase, partial [Acidobacteriaceae bacterium]|nr:DegT/DnrJ/EryC1/StrS family aminotransferase [Acidobacteriaceae bacterium]
TPVRNRHYAPWPQYGKEEETALLDVLHSREWGGYHPAIRELEANFAAHHHVPHGVSCANGTVALEVALRALEIGPGDEVIVTPYSFVASASAILLCRATPVFADISPESFNLSPAAAEAAITPRTRAIIVVHFGGRPAEMDAFRKLAERHNLAVIEDAAHAHGARWQGIPVGGWGDAATFSFQSFKLATAGEGGMILTRSSQIAERCWSYCNQGRKRGGGWFDHFSLGTNYRMTAFQAAVLNAQLRRMPEQTRTRAANVAYFREALRDIPGLMLPEEDPRIEQHPHYLLTFWYQPEEFSGAPRELVLEALQAEGIPFKLTYPHPLYRNPLFVTEQSSLARHGWSAAQDYPNLHLPVAERVCREGVWLSHTVFLGEKRDVDDVLEALRKVQQLAPTLEARVEGKR